MGVLVQREMETRALGHSHTLHLGPAAIKLKLREAALGTVFSVRTEQVLAVQAMCAKPTSALIVTTGTAENGVLKLMV